VSKNVLIESQNMNLRECTDKFTNAVILLRQGKADASANLAAPLLEALLRKLIFDNLDKFDRQLNIELEPYQQDPEKFNLNVMAKLCRNLPIFDAIQKINGRTTYVLKNLNLFACMCISLKLNAIFASR
jgi:hypothetical protein